MSGQATATDAPILIVDDNAAKRLAMRAILEPLGHTLVEAESGMAALRCVLARDFAVILVDIHMPVMDGYDTAALIGQRQRSESTPIIFVTAYRSDEVSAVKGYASGAVDFVFVPFNPEVVRAKVSVFVDLFLKNLALQRSLAEITTLSQEFRDAEIRSRTILDNVADGIVTCGADGVIEGINRAAAVLFGYREGEVGGKPFELLFVPEAPGTADLTRTAQAETPALNGAVFHTGAIEVVGARKDGTTFPMEVELTDVELGARIVRIGCMRDISDRKKHIQALEYQALHDALTGLPNRTLFGDRLLRAIAAAKRGHTSFAVLLLDLDGFKTINDTLGHEGGDLLLRALAERVNNALRNSDTVARLGGDEFGVLAIGPADLDGTSEVAWKIQQVLQPVFDIAGHPVEIRASIGISRFPDHGTDPDDLLRRADLAMYDAKRTSSGVAFYTTGSEENTADDLARLARLRHCIERDELVLHYQPKIDMPTGKISGVEALIRWNHPEEGLLAPDRFMSHVERSELIKPVTRWVIDQALRQQRIWWDAGLHLTMAVNVSGRSLVAGSDLPDILAERSATWGIPAGDTVLELTESSLIDAASPGVLERLHELGYRLSIDDFGTGYSSLASLQRMPVDEIKIDRSFVTNLATDRADAIIVRSTVDLAHNLGLTVVAEGVEDAAALSLLRQYGSDAAQGYFFLPPCAADDLLSWLADSPFASLGPPGATRPGAPSRRPRRPGESPKRRSVGGSGQAARTASRKVLPAVVAPARLIPSDTDVEEPSVLGVRAEWD